MVDASAGHLDGIVPGRPLAPATVVWEGTQFAYHSLALINREVCSQLLDRRGLELSIEPYEPAQFSSGGDAKLVALEAAHRRQGGSPAQVHVRHMWPPKFEPPGSGAWVLMQPWEYGCIPRTWVPHILDRVDEVWTPSTFSKRAFTLAGIPDERVVVIPNGVDPDLFNPEGPKFPLKTARPFKFLFVGNAEARKGLDVTLAAYARAVGSHADACLVIKGTGAASVYKDHSARGMVQAAWARDPGLEVELIEDDLTEAQMAALYRACDVLVAPYRGEGFCMPIAEAMATGLPTLVTGSGAALDYCDDETSYLVPAGTIRCNLLDFPPPALEYWLASPDIDVLVELMEHALAHPDEARARGARARERIVGAFTWKHAADRYEARIRALAGLIPRRFRAGEDTSTRGRDQVTVIWEGTQFAYHSLALINREVCSQFLDRQGLEISIEPFEPAQFTSMGDPRLMAIEAAHRKPTSSPPQVHVRHLWPPKFEPPRDGAWVMLQPWEYGSIPEAWLPYLLESVDEVWTPSTYSKAAFTRAGVPDERVVVVPNGVDVEIFRPDGPSYPLGTHRSFRFLFVGSAIHRKGMDAALLAYAAGFGNATNTCLVVKATGVQTFYQGVSARELVETIRARAPGIEVELVEDDLTEVQMAALYRACDVLVAPYRGEAFCMPIAEAMASGLPTIVTGFGAALDYCDDETSYLVPASLVRCIPEGSSPAAIEYVLAEPDVAALARSMQHVVDHAEEARSKGMKARARIAGAYTWKHVADRYEARMRELSRITPRRFQADHVDPGVFHPDARPLQIEGLRRFNFLAIPRWDSAAWVLALDTYLQSFGPEDDVALVLRAGPDAAGIEERVLGELTRLGHDPEAIADVVIVSQAIARESLAGLYSACQAYLDVGDDRCRREAVACGLAVLADTSPDGLRRASFHAAHAGWGSR